VQQGGSLEVYPDRIAASLGIPVDVLSPILQMLIAKQCKFIPLTGSKFWHRSARLHGFRQEMKLTRTTSRCRTTARAEKVRFAG
jgi:hypothetical protein